MVLVVVITQFVLPDIVGDYSIIGDKIKKDDIAYNGKEYTIETEEQAKEAAKRFSDEVS